METENSVICDSAALITNINNNNNRIDNQNVVTGNNVQDEYGSCASDALDFIDAHETIEPPPLRSSLNEFVEQPSCDNDENLVEKIDANSNNDDLSIEYVDDDLYGVDDGERKDSVCCSSKIRNGTEKTLEMHTKQSGK